MSNGTREETNEVVRGKMEYKDIVQTKAPLPLDKNTHSQSHTCYHLAVFLSWERLQSGFIPIVTNDCSSRRYLSAPMYGSKVKEGKSGMVLVVVLLLLLLLLFMTTIHTSPEQ